MVEDVEVEVCDGPFAGFRGVVVSRIGDRLMVDVALLGRSVPVELHIEQVRILGGAHSDLPTAIDPHAVVREEIIAEHDRLPETEAFGYVLERVDLPETDLAGEWDAYLAHRDEAQAEVKRRKQVALDRYERELASLPVDAARRVVEGDPAFWSPDSALSRRQRERFPEPTAEDRLLAAIFGRESGQPDVTRYERARDRLDRARLAAEERDYERWTAALPAEERHAYPARGNPTRYAYARASRHDVSLPEERSAELAIRSVTGVNTGPIPPELLDAVDGLRLELHRPADLTPLGQLRHLRWLSVRSSVVIDMAALAAALRSARSLRELTVEAPVDDITPLAQLKQVRNLRLEHTRVADLSPLAVLTGLRDLSIGDSPLEDLTPLSGLCLERLFVYRTRVRDLSPLAGMATLTVLGLAGCPVRDLSVVTTLPALHFVNLRHTAVTDLGDLPDRAPHVTFEGVFDQPTNVPSPASATSASVPEDNLPPVPLPDAQAEDLLAEFRAVGYDYPRRGPLERRMLAGRRPDLVQEIIRESAYGGPTVVGLLVSGGIGDVPFADNPWGITTDSGLGEALTQVWAPIAAFAPRFVAAVHSRTLALALLSDGDGSPTLGYLTWRRDDDGTGQLVEPPASLDQFADPTRDYHLQVLLGSAPRRVDPTAVVPRLAGPVPRPVRDLWAIHHRLGPSAGDSVGGGLDCNTLEHFPDDSWSTVTQRLGGLPPDRFVHSAGHGNYDDYVLDLDVLDEGGNPTVACWAFKEWEVGHRMQYWDWLDGTGTHLLFGP